MFEFFRNLTQSAVPIFVISTMLNVGLTQNLSDLLGHLRDWGFVLRMLLANFVLVPLATLLMLNYTSFDPALKTGLLIFGLCAGAPFLVKLTQVSENDLSLGAATMLVLVVGTVIYVPLVLPLILSGIEVDAGAIARSLFTQLILPIIAGMLAAQFLPGPAKAAQPWVARLGNLTLYLVIGATLLGYFPNMVDIVGTGAIFVGLTIVAAAFAIGFLLGGQTDALHDVGGLGTAQRNTAAGLLIATQNFSDPNVLVILTLANTLGIVMLMIFARVLSRDNPPLSSSVESRPDSG